MRAARRTPLRAVGPCGVLAVAVLGGCVAQIEDAQGAITMGIDDANDPAVAALVRVEAPDDVRCTGTLIAPRVLITAAHCEIDGMPQAWEAFFGASLAGGGTRVPVVAAVSHPAFSGDADHDVALVLLGEPMDLVPVALADAAPGAPPLSARLVGFGYTGGDTADADRKREGTTTIDDVQPFHVVLAAGPSLPCSGDSGGPLFLGAPGAEILTGVVSRGDVACASLARATRVDVHLDDFVVPAMEAWAEGSQVDGQRCYYDAQCTRGACLEALDEPLLRFCSGPCTEDDACEAPLRCEAGACRHPSPSPGALLSPCDVDDDCVRGECVASEGYCSVRCAPSRDECPTGSTCEHIGSIDFYCAPVAPAPSCGCHATHPRTGSFVLAAIAFLLGTTSRRRRRWLGRARRRPRLGQREAP